MIDIAPILTTAPIPKIKKIIRDGQKPPEKKQSKQNENNKKGGGDGNEPQHIDEIV